MIEKLRIKGVWIGEEKELTAKKGPNAGTTFKVCKIGLFTPDEDKKYGGRFIGGSAFASKTQTAKEVAEALKSRVEAFGGEDMILDISESDKADKDGNKYLNFKFPSKKELEVAKQFLK